jgi:hypothetical protein
MENDVQPMNGGCRGFLLRAFYSRIVVRCSVTPYIAWVGDCHVRQTGLVTAMIKCRTARAWRCR